MFSSKTFCHWTKLCVFIKLRQTIKYLEFLSLSDAKKYESKFDFDPTDSPGGDIVYKILGIEQNETMTRAPSIIISKKVRQNQDVDIIEEEESDALGPPDQLESLKNLLRQEELRDDGTSTPTAPNRMKRITSSSKSLLNKKINSIKLMHSSSKVDNPLMHESQSDIALYKPAVTFRDSAAELGSTIIKKVKKSHAKYVKSSSDGVGMAALLVRSMMAAPSLDSIAENVDQSNIPPSHLKPISQSDIGNSSSLISLPTKKHHHHLHEGNKLNISVGDSIIDLKASDGNLSSGVSMSSVTMSETSSEDDECSELGDEVVMIDADTISM